MISKMESEANERHRFLVWVSSWVMQNTLISPSLAPAWHRTAEKLYHPECVYIRVCLCVCVLMCAIEYAHCTQPAQGEDPFSHQIFTSNHRLPAACYYNAHALPCYLCLMHSLKKGTHKIFEVNFEHRFSSLHSSVSSVNVIHLQLDTANLPLECMRAGLLNCE